MWTRRVSHRYAERVLLGLSPGEVASRLGVVIVRNPDGWTWAVDFGPDMLLLAAVDSLLRLAGYRAASERAKWPTGRVVTVTR